MADAWEATVAGAEGTGATEVTAVTEDRMAEVDLAAGRVGLMVEAWMGAEVIAVAARVAGVLVAAYRAVAVRVVMGRVVVKMVVARVAVVMAGVVTGEVKVVVAAAHLVPAETVAAARVVLAAGARRAKA